MRTVTELPPIGSRWYYGGSHWQVVAHTEKEGEPAVIWAPVGKRKPRIARIWRLTAKRALPSNR